MTRCSWNLHNPRTRSEAARRLVSTSKIIHIGGHPFQHKAWHTALYSSTSHCCKFKFFFVPEPSISLLIYSSGLSSNVSSSSSKFGKKKNFNDDKLILGCLTTMTFLWIWKTSLFKRDHYESKELAGIINFVLIIFVSIDDVFIACVLKIWQQHKRNCEDDKTYLTHLWTLYLVQQHSRRYSLRFLASQTGIYSDFFLMPRQGTQ